MSQLEMFPREPWRPQSLEELDGIAMQMADRAQRNLADGFTHQGTYAAYMAMALFGAIDELRRRGHK